MKDDLLALYRGKVPPLDALFLKARAAIIPFEAFDAKIPRAGTILDLGCGHGLFSNYLALSSPERHVIGLDLDAKRIALAKSTVGERANIEFRVGDLRDTSLPPCRAILVVGVLSLVPFPDWDGILEACREALQPGGDLVIQEIEREQRLAFVLVAAKEKLMAATGFTKAAGLFVETTEGMTRRLESLGFTVESERIAIPGHPSRIYTARKSG